MLSDIKLQLYFIRKALPNTFYTVAPGVIVCGCLLLAPHIAPLVFLAPFLAGGSIYLGAEPAALNLLPDRFRPRMRAWLQQRDGVAAELIGMPGGEGYARKLGGAIEAFWYLARARTSPEALDRAAWSIDQQFRWAGRLASLLPKLSTLGDSSAEYIVKLDTAIDVFRESSRSEFPSEALVAQSKEIDDLITLVDDKMTEVVRTTSQATAQEGLNELFRVKKEILDGLTSRQQAEQDASRMINQIKG